MAATPGPGPLYYSNSQTPYTPSAPSPSGSGSPSPPSGQGRGTPHNPQTSAGFSLKEYTNISLPGKAILLNFSYISTVNGKVAHTSPIELYAKYYVYLFVGVMLLK